MSREKVTRFRSEEEKDKVRLRVDKRDRSTGEHTVGLSPRIYNSLSRCDGPLDIHHASPLKSCQRGGRLVTIVSKFELCKDFMPQPSFLVFDSFNNELTRLQYHIQHPAAQGRGYNKLQERHILQEP